MGGFLEERTLNDFDCVAIEVEDLETLWLFCAVKDVCVEPVYSLLGINILQSNNRSSIIRITILSLLLILLIIGGIMGLTSGIYHLQIKLPGAVLTEEDHPDVILPFWLPYHWKRNILQLLKGQMNRINLLLDQQISFFLYGQSTVFDGIGFHLALTVPVGFRLEHFIFICIF